MAGKPTVTMTLAGDEKKLTEAFDKVGTAAGDMGDKVDSASKQMDDSGSRLDAAGEAADGAESKFMGFHDVLDGVKGAFETLSDPSASFTDKLIGLGQAGADVAGGMASFLIPAIKAFWTRLMATTAATYLLTAAQTTWAAVTKATSAAMAILNAVMRANPILFIVGLIATLVGAFIVLWNKSAGFRNFFIGVWRAIQSVVGTVVGWIRDRFVWFINWVRNSPIGKVFKAIFDGIAAVVRGVGKAVMWLVDRIKDAIDWVRNLMDFGSGVDELNAKVAHRAGIPGFATGGTVPGMPGEPRLVLAHGGERIRTARQSSGGAVTIHVAPGADRGVAELIDYLARNRFLTAVVTQ